MPSLVCGRSVMAYNYSLIFTSWSRVVFTLSLWEKHMISSKYYFLIKANDKCKDARKNEDILFISKHKVCRSSDSALAGNKKQI